MTREEELLRQAKFWEDSHAHLEESIREQYTKLYDPHMENEWTLIEDAKPEENTVITGFDKSSLTEKTLVFIDGKFIFIDEESDIELNLTPQITKWKPIESVLVWRVVNNGSYFVTENIQDVISIISTDLSELSEGDHIIIKRLRMSKEKFNSLPDFDGF